jgi:hypothetical protein
VKWFGTVVNFYPSAFAEELVAGSFISILEATPAADIKHKYRFVVCPPADNIINEGLQSWSVLDVQAAFCWIGIRSYDLEVLQSRVSSNCGHLVEDRIFLTLG